MSIYETIFIINPDYTDEQDTEILNKVKEVLKKGGAETKFIEDWGVKKLAYRVAKQLRGHYFIIYYESKPAMVWELERNLKISEGVLKYMTVKLARDEIVAMEEKSKRKNKEDMVKKAELAEKDKEVESSSEKSLPADSEDKTTEEPEGEKKIEESPDGETKDASDKEIKETD